MLFLISDSHDKSVIESGDLSGNIQRGDGSDRANSSVGGNQLAILLGAPLIACLDTPELISQLHDTSCCILVYQPRQNNNTPDNNNQRINEILKNKCKMMVQLYFLNYLH